MALNHFDVDAGGRQSTIVDVAWRNGGITDE
jgi:hypothetical protein